MKKIYLFLLLTSVLISCEKSDPVECYLIDKPIITSNSPVISGNDIVLSSNSNDNLNGGKYIWTGPNGFTSTEPNPIISNASIDMIGEYKLKYKRGICETEEVSTNIDVIVNNSVTCTPNNNKGIFTDLFYNVSYYYISTGVSNNQFYLYAGGSETNLTITFSNNNSPINGIYSIVPSSSTLSQGQVYVTMKRGYSNQLTYTAKTGDVLVSKVNGKLYAILCNVPFYFSTNNSPSNYGTIKITEE